MNPVFKSMLTSALGFALTAAATWLVKSGIITADQTATFIELASGMVLAAGALAVGWWKSRQHTPAAQITAIENMPVITANAAVAALPTTAKNMIRIATMPDATLVAAAAALPGVAKVDIAYDAGRSLSALAEDPGLPKIVTQGAKS